MGPCMSLVTLSPAWLSFPLTASRLGLAPRLPAPQMIARLGREINHPDSIYYWAWKNDIPVFCPALTGAPPARRVLPASPAERRCWAALLSALYRGPNLLKRRLRCCLHASAPVLHKHPATAALRMPCNTTWFWPRPCAPQHTCPGLPRSSAPRCRRLAGRHALLPHLQEPGPHPGHRAGACSFIFPASWRRRRQEQFCRFGFSNNAAKQAGPLWPKRVWSLPEWPATATAALLSRAGVG